MNIFKNKRIWIFTFVIILSAGVYALIMTGLIAYSDLNGALDETDDDLRDPQFQFFDGNSTKLLNQRLTQILWETKAIDIIALGFILMVASECAATVIKGIEDQCNEFKGLCDTDKFDWKTRPVETDEQEEQEAE
jgi:hypothetical protein